MGQTRGEHGENTGTLRTRQIVQGGCKWHKGLFVLLSYGTRKIWAEMKLGINKQTHTRWHDSLGWFYEGSASQSKGRQLLCDRALPEEKLLGEVEPCEEWGFFFFFKWGAKHQRSCTKNAGAYLWVLEADPGCRRICAPPQWERDTSRLRGRERQTKEYEYKWLFFVFFSIAVGERTMKMINWIVDLFWHYIQFSLEENKQTGIYQGARLIWLTISIAEKHFQPSSA